MSINEVYINRALSFYWVDPLNLLDWLTSLIKGDIRLSNWKLMVLKKDGGFEYLLLTFLIKVNKLIFINKKIHFI